MLFMFLDPTIRIKTWEEILGFQWGSITKTKWEDCTASLSERSRNLESETEKEESEQTPLV